MNNIEVSEDIADLRHTLKLLAEALAHYSNSHNSDWEFNGEGWVTAKETLNRSIQSILYGDKGEETVNNTDKLTEINKDEAKIVRLMHSKGDPYNPAGHYIFISFKGVCHQLLLSMDPPNNPSKDK